MNSEELNIVKHRLSEYRNYEILAKNAELEILEKENQLLSIGLPKSPNGGSGHSQNPVSMDSVMISVMSDQKDLQDLADRYRKNMSDIFRFIHDNVSGEVRDLMMQHYCHGRTYEDMTTEINRSASGMRMMVDRTLMAIPFDKANKII